MCGIAGFVKYTDMVALAHLANDIQKHRGPDNQSVWHDKHVAFAHQRLSIIDIDKRSDQPMVKNNLVIVFNGEIYNYKQLKIKYLQDVHFTTESDTEVILEMFNRYNSHCLDYFIGMFSFVIYNMKTKELFAARDHFGIKPFFYTKTNSGFAFSSELKTLTRLPDFNNKINIKTLLSSLNYLWTAGNETMFVGSYKLPPGHFLIIDEDLNIKIEKYWDLSDKVIYKKENDYFESLRKQIEDSIERHMIADVPVSSFLSGGLDSSLISVLAQKWNPDLSTYTITIDKKDKKVERMPDDEKYAELLANKFKFKKNMIEIKADIINLLPGMVRFLDEPIADPAAINTYLICKAAHEKGSKVLLSGMGADEIFFGYRRMKATEIAQSYKKLPKPFRALINFIIDILPVRAFGYGFRLSRWAKKFISFASLPLDEAYRMSYSYYTPEELNKITKFNYPDLISALQNDHHEIFNSKFINDRKNQMCNTDINMFMVGLNLTYTDRASMASSVEVRVPFIDKLLISEAMSIPGQLKYVKKESKYILKRISEQYLPREIIYRPKTSFGAPIRSWISNDLKEMVDDLLSTENINKRGILDAEYISTLIQRDRKGLEDNAYRIYQLLTLELWFREFIDK